jgi:hypothetical protein
MSKNPQDTDTSHTNAKQKNGNNKNSNYKLVERETVPNSPFTLIKFEEKGWYITIAQNRLSEAYENKEEAIKYIEQKPWELIIKVILAINGMDIGQ